VTVIPSAAADCNVSSNSFRKLSVVATSGPPQLMEITAGLLVSS
jgi:hypothetical protein